MLESIRKSRNSMIILFAFAAIIIVFIFWGVGPGGKDGGSNAVAVVDGDEISARDYANLYKREVEYYKNTFKEQFNDELAKKMNLKERALDILINRSLAMKEAKAEGIKVSEKEVQEAITAIPAFSKDGAFDKDTYFKVLSANRMKPAEFEKSVEQDLLTAKIRDRIVKDIKVTDAEIKEAYMKENRKFDFNYVAVEGSRFASSIKVTDDEAKEYLKKNGSAFMTPVKIKAFYAYASYNDIAKKVKVSEAEIKEFYERNKKDLEIPPAVKARHILVRPDEKAADKEKAKKEAKDKAEALLKKIKAGGNFAELAKANSQDPGSAKQGGELGWFQKGVMVKQFEEAAFALKKGETSGLVETEFGYHIIKVEDKKDAGVMSLEEAKDSLVKALSAQKAHNNIKEALNLLEKPFKEAKNVEELKKAASANKDIKTGETPLFSEEDNNVALVRNETLRDAVFQLKGGEVSRVIDTPEGTYLIKAVERVDAHVPDYAEVAGKVKERLAAEKANEAAKNKAEEMIKKVKGGEDIAQIAKTEKFKVDSTGYFSRSEGFIPKIGAFAGDKEQLFEVKMDKPYYPEVLPHNNKFYVLKLNGIKDPDEAGLEKRKDELKARLLAVKQDEALNKWLLGLRSKAKIKINEQLM